MERAYVRHIAVIVSGETFGDLSFRTPTGIRTSTVRTTRPCEMLLVEKDDYNEIMCSESALERFARDQMNIEELKTDFELIQSFVC
jgi:CRP-like cAMP-binding protein